MIEEKFEHEIIPKSMLPETSEVGEISESKLENQESVPTISKLNEKIDKAKTARKVLLDDKLRERADGRVKELRKERQEVILNKIKSFFKSKK